MCVWSGGEREGEEESLLLSTSSVDMECAKQICSVQVRISHDEIDHQKITIPSRTISDSGYEYAANLGFADMCVFWK